ncbi:MAG: cytochrome c biogenesis protein CcsA [Methanosarcinales archaeon]|nr:cytochrome c biogenesis protein CcsA [Methanosarcinales archaeon]
MNIGDIFLYLSFLTGLLTLLLMWESPRLDFLGRLVPYRNWSMRISATFLSLAVALLVYYFLVSDFSIHYVYSYSSLDLSPIYKLSALWTGEEGSMLFFALGLMLIAAYMLEKYESGAERHIILSLGLLLLLLTIQLGPFTNTLDAHPDMTEVPQDGQGLNPLLVNIWMVFHPPGIFIGYALMSVIFASAAVQGPEWESKCRGAARWAWLVLGAGIVSGCIWSYEVWESYWIWDPAFTSSLLVWLMLTAYLHTAARFRKSRDLRLLSPATGIMSFVIALYSVYIIRSGTIQSVHSFGENGRNMLLLSMVVVLFVISIGMIIHWGMKKKEKQQLPDSEGLLSESNLFLLTTIIFLMLSAVLFTGLSYSLILDIFGSGMAISIELFNDWSYPLTILLLVTMGLCMFGASYRRVALILVAILLLLVTGFDVTHDTYDNISVAVIVFAALAGLYRISRAAVSKTPAWARLRSASPHLVHLGIAIMLIGVLMSTYSTGETIYFRSFNEKKMVGDFEIQLVNLAFPVQHDHYTATLTKIGTYTIYRKNGSIIATGDASFEEIGGEYITRPFIYNGLLSDVRITYQGIGTTTPIFISFANIRIVPGMTVIWAGCILILVGIVPGLSGRTKKK